MHLSLEVKAPAACLALEKALDNLDRKLPPGEYDIMATRPQFPGIEFMARTEVKA